MAKPCLRPWCDREDCDTHRWAVYCETPNPFDPEHRPVKRWLVPACRELENSPVYMDRQTAEKLATEYGGTICPKNTRSVTNG